MKKWVYNFGNGMAEGRASDRPLLGGKGANLAEMCHLGLPVPPGFTISTEACRWFFSHQRKMPEGLEAEVRQSLDKVGEQTGRVFGDPDNPLLLSVRSGSRASMPGMMDTVLNLGLNDTTVMAIARSTGDARFAWDSYRRFIHMYGNVVMGVDHDMFEELLEDARDEGGYLQETEMSADDLKRLVARYKAMLREEIDEAFPQDPFEQLWRAISGVFSSWMNRRAVTYRALHDIPVEWGTAVNVQAMVFGNLGSDSATGVAFTRNPSTGERTLYGEFLINAQGEDVVAGIRTPQNITERARIEAGSDKPSLEKLMPCAYAEFRTICDQLERHYNDMQDLEFTIEQGKLWMLQTRSGKRTARAAIRIAVDMAKEGMISRAEAITRIEPASLDQLLHPTIAPQAERDILATGLPASPGAATGEIVFTSEEAVEKAREGTRVVLVRVETSPEDIHGMNAADGILTTRGGMTSHAAVVARGMGKPCVSGAGSLRVDLKAEKMVAGARVLRRGDVITLDGTSGQVLVGAVAMLQPELSGDFGELMEWADGERRMAVRANAETPADAHAARSFGAEGIGLCRTEHMFFQEERILAMREMILSDSEEGRRAALARLLPMQQDDFVALFEIMRGLPVTIRLLDPPLHEFLPKSADEIDDVATAMGMSADRLRQRLDELHEFNPMLGHRGCRLAISYPEIAEMQARAIFQAAVLAAGRTGAPVQLEIMVPLVGLKSEMDFVRAIIDDVARQIGEQSKQTLDYLVGTMIELPRAAIQADRIAETAEFFSFGTNDLTQTTFGISRDDAVGFLATYQRKGLIDVDPFVSLDRDGVGELVQLAVDRGRAVRPDIKLGICGEHGGDPSSIAFFEEIGLDYVSCSPFRVPIARVSAAQAAIRQARAASMDEQRPAERVAAL